MLEGLNGELLKVGLSFALEPPVSIELDGLSKLLLWLILGPVLLVGVAIFVGTPLLFVGSLVGSIRAVEGENSTGAKIWLRGARWTSAALLVPIFTVLATSFFGGGLATKGEPNLQWYLTHGALVLGGLLAFAVLVLLAGAVRTTYRAYCAMEWRPRRQTYVTWALLAATLTLNACGATWFASQILNAPASTRR